MLQKIKHLLEPDMAYEVVFIYNDEKIKLLSVPLDESFARHSHYLIPNRVKYLLKSSGSLPEIKYICFFIPLPMGGLNYSNIIITHVIIWIIILKTIFSGKDSENIFCLDALFSKKCSRTNIGLS